MRGRFRGSMRGCSRWCPVSEPTEADREAARKLLHPGVFSDRAADIAKALADERAKARAPFLRLLERLDKPSGLIGRDREAVTWMAEHLRAAAQEQP
jgi:hypothetical protein